MRSTAIARSTVLTAAIAVAVASWSAAASAGDRYGYHGYGKYRYGPPRHVVQHHYHPRKHHYRHRHRDGAYLLGGIVIGSILTHALTAPPTYAAPARVVRYESRAVSRRLFRDIDGNCFERRHDGAGSELLIELPPSECAW